MKTLTLGNITKTFFLVSAGAMLGIFLLAPLGVGASDDDPAPRIPVTRTFTMVDNFGVPAKFTLVENGGHLFLNLVDEPRYAPRPTDDD